MIATLGVMVETGYPLAVLAIALILDYCIGDPWNWVHPVQVIGWWISRFSQMALKWIEHPLALKMTGIILGLSTILGTGLVDGLLIKTA
ncbi:MAG: cobalamin biosynthesis protein, partial [Symploca sp. SIO2B6]|nr:cobalamin biosynthesis protein [Symploca sp. SIO2B6]